MALNMPCQINKCWGKTNKHTGLYITNSVYKIIKIIKYNIMKHKLYINI